MNQGVLKKKLEAAAVSPYVEMLSYEYLYSRSDTNLKKLTEKTVLSNRLPSQVYKETIGMLDPDDFSEVENMLKTKLGKLSVAVNNTPSWPNKLADSERPTPLFYYYGDVGLMDVPSVSVVGSRKASKAGLSRARRMAKELSKAGFTIVSGLASGIDTAALTSAIESDGNVIGVIGTPIDEYYPKENKGLQDLIGDKHLLVSQVPFYKYSKQSFSSKKFYFPERNELMAAISDATVIIEASDTSGTLTQARACLHQKRPLFILKSCYENQDVEWPRKWAERENVHVVDSSHEIVSIIGA